MGNDQSKRIEALERKIDDYRKLQEQQADKVKALKLSNEREKSRLDAQVRTQRKHCDTWLSSLSLNLPLYTDDTTFLLFLSIGF